MISYYQAVMMGYSIIIAAVIGLISFRKILPSYQPFFYFIWFDLLNHTLSVIFNETIGFNTVNSNIAVLIESFLFIWLFNNWGAFKYRKGMLMTVCILLFIVWCYDNLVAHNLRTVNSLYRVFYSFVLIFLCIEHINRLIVKETKTLLRNADFLICTGLLIYCTYKATTEVFYLIELKASNRFYINIFIILVFINFFVNLIYAWAAIWIPRRQKY